jgi:hypothetical protein
VHRRRRYLVPYLLMGVLTLGAGLGAGLSLSDGPVTFTPVQGVAAAQSPQSFDGCFMKGMVKVHDTDPTTLARDQTRVIARCEATTGYHDGGSTQHFFENLSGPIPRGHAVCVSTSGTTRLVPLGSAAFKKALTQTGETCTWHK